MLERNVLEALEINKVGTINEKDRTFKVLNRDYVTINTWKTLFINMGNH